MRVRGKCVLHTDQDQDNPPCRATAASHTVHERGEDQEGMCGIAGRMLRQPGAIGPDLVAMLTAQSDCGAEPTGLALYGEPLAAGFVVRALLADRATLDADLEAIRAVTRHHGADLLEDPTCDETDQRHVSVRLSISDPEPFSEWVDACDALPGVELQSAGRALEIVKDLGDAQEVADKHGVPFDALSGSGVHIHQSLWRDGVNAFPPGGQLSELGRHYLGGLQHHLPAITLFGSPTPNAFRRRQDYSLCPTTAIRGGDNRTDAVRVVEGAESAVGIEQRDGSADCNPYLVIAAQLAAGLDGIEPELEPGPRCDADGYAVHDAAVLAPSVPDAIAALEKSELPRAWFDPVLLETYVGFGRYQHNAITSR